MHIHCRKWANVILGDIGKGPRRQGKEQAGPDGGAGDYSEGDICVSTCKMEQGLGCSGLVVVKKQVVKNSGP